MGVPIEAEVERLYKIADAMQDIIHWFEEDHDPDHEDPDKPEDLKELYETLVDAKRL